MRKVSNQTYKSLVILTLLVAAFLIWNKYNMDKMENYKYEYEDKMTNTQSSNKNIEIVPIEHATMVMKWGGKIIYTDPVGGREAFVDQPEPDLILITDIHGDHLDIKTLETVSRSKTVIITPMAVADKLLNTIAGDLLVIKNGQKTNQKTSQKVNLNGFSIEAIPMYNLPEKADAYHVKGRGNGYVISDGSKRVYISGDTADIPEMRNLKNIDIAFVSMNLPFTMSVESAASGVLAFKPAKVYPYHYRGPDGLADINKFKSLVNSGDSNIEVILLNWYP